MPKMSNLEEFLHDMESGVYNFTDNGKCVSCGNCCTAKKCNIYEVRPTICRDFKCDKPQRMIDETKEKYNYDNRFHTVNMRSIF